MRNDFLGETAARQGRARRGCFCPQCGQVRCCERGTGVACRAACGDLLRTPPAAFNLPPPSPFRPTQLNHKMANNNYMKCWSCTSHFCYVCRALLRSTGTHYKPGMRCKQHSAD